MNGGSLKMITTRGSLPVVLQLSLPKGHCRISPSVKLPVGLPRGSRPGFPSRRFQILYNPRKSNTEVSSKGSYPVGTYKGSCPDVPFQVVLSWGPFYSVHSTVTIQVPLRNWVLFKRFPPRGLYIRLLQGFLSRGPRLDAPSRSYPPSVAINMGSSICSPPGIALQGLPLRAVPPEIRSRGPPPMCLPRVRLEFPTNWPL